MWEVGGIKIERTRARNICFRRDTEIGEKVIFWVKRENFSGPVPTESLRTQDSENVYERWVQQIFDHVLVARSWVSAKKWGPLAKLLGVTKKCISQNLRI